MAHDSESKILRIGLIQSGRVVEERLLRKRHPISVGQSGKNTFVIPLSRLPFSYTLFEYQGGRYLLRFVRGMEGRVTVEGKVVDLKTLVAQKKVVAQGNAFLFPLSTENRGKIVLGDITLLFQFVAPPPAPAKIRLTDSPPISFWKQVDLFFAIILGVFILVHGVSGIGIEYWWLTTGRYLEEDSLSRERQMLSLRAEVLFKNDKEEKKVQKELAADLLNNVTPPPEEAWNEAQQEGNEGLEDVELPPTGEQGGRAQGPIDPDAAKRQKYERQLARVKNSTMLKFLVSSGGPGGSVIAKDGVTAQKLSDAWESGGVVIADDGERRFYQGGARPGEGGGANRYVKLDARKYTGRIQTGKVQVAEKQEEVQVKVKIRGNLSSSSGSAADKAGVTDVFRRRQSAIRYCYEKVLKLHPDAQGKVTIQFTIGGAGRITEIVVVSDSTGIPEIGQCILEKVQSWRFQPPEKGPARFTYPFILSKG